jgi:hypothetical protein
VDDAGKATTAAGAALTGGLVDQEHASQYVAEYFRVEDVPEMVQKIAAEKQADAALLEQQMMQQMQQETQAGAAPTNGANGVGGGHPPQ